MTKKSDLQKVQTAFNFLVISLMILSQFSLGTRRVAADGPSSPPDCTDPLGCVTIDPTGAMHIAYALTISGPNASLGIDARNGVEIAIDDAGGEILGHDIQFDGQDEGCSGAGGSAAGTALAADASVVAVIGTSCSSAARTAMPLLAAAGKVMVSPSNTGSDLTESGNPNNYPGYLRTIPSDSVQGTAAAQFVRQFLGVTTAATIQDGSVYSSAIVQAFATEFVGLGGTITASKTIDPSQTDMSAELSDIAAGAPGLIYFPVFLPAGGYIINQARGMTSLQSTYLMGSDVLYTPDVVTAAGANVEGFMVTGYDESQYSPDYANHFLPAYLAKFGTQPTNVFHAQAYDAFMMIKAAIEKVAWVGPDGSIQIGRQALRDAMYGTTNFSGLTGTLTCTPTGDCADPHIAVYRYHAGQDQPVKIWPGVAPVLISGNAGVAGVTLSYTDGSAKTTMADSSGNYSFTVSYDWSGTVTASKPGYAFTPTHRTYTDIDVDQPAEDYIATPVASFSDVPTTYWAWNWIERLYSAGITGGCGGGNYCPTSPVTRAQMAIFLERGMNGSSYTPPGGTGTIFGDVPISYWSVSWIEKLSADGITGGCGGGNYSPGNPVTRAQMAIFLLRAEHGSSYTPPSATGTVFGDVPISYWDAAWIEKLSAEGITGGCGGGNYCPANPVTRAQMAILLVRTFNLP